MYNLDMKREKVLKILHDHQAELEVRGIRNLALFGSVARDEAKPESDVDILVEFDRPVGLFGLVELQDYLENILGCKVDLGTPDSLKEHSRQNVMEDCYYVTPPMG